MKKYFLITFGNFTADQCGQIAITLTPLVDSPQLKFQTSATFAIYHFATEILQEEIYEYIKGNLFDVVHSFILTENNDNLSLFMPKDVENHLLYLENKSEDVVIDMNFEDIKNRLEEIEEESDDEDFVALLLDKVKKNVKKPTLDQLLDKINNSENGIESLSQFEKDTLESYSKN
jgi:hypothetical protein